MKQNKPDIEGELAEYILLFKSDASTPEQPRYDVCDRVTASSAKEAIDIFHMYDNDGTALVVRVVAVSESTLIEGSYTND